MRSLQRNCRSLYYAVPESTESIYDEYGNDTLEKRITYGEPVELKVNVSANAGQEAVNVFGTMTGYNRTVSYSGTECPLSEDCVVWFGRNPSENHNYVVVKIADSKNGFMIALREVSDRG